MVYLIYFRSATRRWRQWLPFTQHLRRASHPPTATPATLPLPTQPLPRSLGRTPSPGPWAPAVAVRSGGRPPLRLARPARLQHLSSGSAPLLQPRSGVQCGGFSWPRTPPSHLTLAQGSQVRPILTTRHSDPTLTGISPGLRLGLRDRNPRCNESFATARHLTAATTIARVLTQARLQWTQEHREDGERTRSKGPKPPPRQVWGGKWGEMRVEGGGSGGRALGL